MNKWIDIKSESPPMDIPVLVYIEREFLGSRYHTAVYHTNVSFVAGHFKFDVPKVTHWKLIELVEE